MSAFYRASVTLITAADPVTVTGYALRALPVLTVTRITPRHGWTVTHAPTGRAVTRPLPLREAKRRAAAIAAALPADIDLTTSDPTAAALRMQAYPAAMEAVYGGR